MTNLIGKSLGRYHILEQLGEGGMAVVYKAYDTRLERNVAIKVILPQKQHTEKFIKRFEREAKALARLSHPNIVKVIDYGEHEGIPFLVMEYIPGGTLKQKLSGKPMPWRDAVKILIPIARALGYAHQQKIVHRDLKPSNILITDSGEPMLSDFGIAKILETEETLDLTGTGVGVGTPEYMSPEQAQGKPVDARSDIYSLGVVLYEMVTGRRPYQADTPMAVVWKLASEPLPQPKSFVSDVPESAELVLLKALSKSPDNRYQDMADLTKALESALSDAKTRVSTPHRGINKQYYLIGGLFALAGVTAIIFWGVNRSAWMAKLPQPSREPTSIAPTRVELQTTEVSDVNCNDSPSASNFVPNFAFTKMELYDDFSESDYDGSYDQRKWGFEPNTAIQSQGHLLLFSKGSMVRGELPVSARNGISATLCVTEFRGNNFSVLVKFFARLNYSWQYACSVTSSKDGNGFSCDSMDSRKSLTDSVHVTSNIPINKGQWYRVDIEIDPATGNIRSYLDGQLIDVYIPDNAQDILGTNVAFTVDTWAGTASTGIALVDNVRLGIPTNLNASPATSTEGTYLILEDFESGKVQMYGFSTDSNRWRIVDDGTGNKVFQIDNRNGTGTPGFSFGADEWKDYIAEYRVKYLEENGYLGLQVLSNGIDCYISNLSTGELYLAYGSSQGWDRLKTVNPPIQRNKWYTVRIEAINGQIQVFIDGNRWVNVTDSRVQHGWLLMFAEAGTYAQVDDIKILESGN
jgi:serine/threonine protein kinase